MDKCSERQYGESLSEIAPDHVERYRFAATKLARYDRVLDAACGCGYGSSILHDAGCMVDGIDASSSAITFAEEFYPGPTYRIMKIEAGAFPRKWYDAVVSFETIEHLRDPLHALQLFKDRTDGLIVSTPNEELYPFMAQNFEGDEHPHIRHYTPQELEDLLNSAGFKVEAKFHQKNKSTEGCKVEEGTEGKFLVYVCGSR